MTSFQGKVVAVTGAGSGIGRELALGLARRGARLALADVNSAEVAQTQRLAAHIGAEVRSDVVDVSDRAAVQTWVQAVADQFGAVNQIFNNAGISGVFGSVLESDWETFEKVLSVNLWGVIHCTKEFLPHLIASGDGHVVNVSSLNGFLAQPNLSAYSASKFAVRGFTEALRSELVLSGLPVQVTVVHPGGVSTNIASASLSATADAKTSARVKTHNEKLLKMPPATAAKIILDGVESNRPRVLVGNDAKAVDLIVRLIPRHAPRVAAWFETRIERDAATLLTRDDARR